MRTIMTKFPIIFIACCFFQVHARKSKHSKGKQEDKISRSSVTINKLGFKPMKIGSNKTLQTANNTLHAEYNRLRLSAKHKHKIRRKDEVLLKANVTGKRSKITRKDHVFHLATEDKFKDQRATKRFNMDDGHHLDERPILGQCDINKQCKADQYCEGTHCFKCRKEEEHCYANGQCCKGMECQYGYCAGGVSAGMPGTYCDKAKDCKGSDACCILEMSVDHHNPICKPMLEEHETCGPINLFHQICSEYRAQNEPICGPCKQGLACKSIGINGHHSVCLPEGGD